MKSEPKPDAWEIDFCGYVISQLTSLEEILGGMESSHFGPDFEKACDAAYATRRYLEIELTQYEAQSNDHA